MASTKISQLPVLATMSNSTVLPVVDGGVTKTVTGSVLRTYTGTASGPQGPQGVAGSQGPQGPSGPAGSAASSGLVKIASGSITGGSASATVTSGINTSSYPIHRIFFYNVWATDYYQGNPSGLALRWYSDGSVDSDNAYYLFGSTRTYFQFGGGSISNDGSSRATNYIDIFSYGTRYSPQTMSVGGNVASYYSTKNITGFQLFDSYGFGYFTMQSASYIIYGYNP